MSWSSWGAKLNVQSIVSQGLEQVSKLKEDVEKQFDQVVTASTAQPPGSSSRASAAAAAQGQGHAVEPPSPAVSAALFGDANTNAALPPPPPRSLDSTARTALLSSLSILKVTSAASASSAGNGNAAASAPTSRTSKGSSAPTDFFGSYLSTEFVKRGTTETNEKINVEEKVPSPVAKPSEQDAVPTVPAVDDGASETPQADEFFDAREEKRPVDEEAKLDAVEATGVVGEEARVSPNDGQEAAGDEAELLAKDPTNVEAGSQVHPPENDEVSAGEEAPEVSGENGHQEGESSTHGDTQRENGSHALENGLPSDTEERSTVNTDGANEPEEAIDDNNTDTDAVVTSGEIESLKQQLAQRETQLMSTSGVIQELHDELDKTCQREVAAVEKNRFLNEQLELLRHEVLRLNRVVAQQQQQPSRDHELVAMQEAIAEKDAKLQALLDEGQALSVKQSQLEQRLRQLRREKNEEEEAKLTLQAQNDTISIQLQELTAKHKQADDDKKSLQSELQATQQRAAQAQKERAEAQDDLARHKGRVGEMETAMSALREENESMRAELERLQHTSDSHATLSVEKSEMEATIQYLQQTVHGLDAENARREDMARKEIADLKRKWKDALQRVESLGQSVSEATQPLLRQIHALQEDQRARQDTWKATEQTLLQRINDATAQRKAIETDKLVQDHRVQDLQAQIDELQLVVQRTEAETAREKERVETSLHKEREARSNCDALQIELDELRHKLQDEQHAKKALLARVAMATTAAANDAGAKQRDGDDAHVLAETTALVAEMKQLKQREDQLRHDLEWHQKELQRVKAATLSPRTAMVQQRRSFDEDWSASANGSPRVTSSSQGTAASQASILQRTLDSSVDDSRLSSTSVLGLSQLQQRLRLREGENRLLRQQLQALEDKQKQTTDEIVRLSTRNALLESSAAQFAETQQQLEALKQKQHVLLELFGEKEEQVEELQSEVKELKAFYRKQLDTLAGQHA
jgi:TATA element modulatory factor